MVRDDLNVIYITKFCNLDCLYCYEDGKDFIKMTKEEVVQIIDEIFEHRTKDDSTRILFFGGEPFINWDTLHFGIKYIFENYFSKGYRVAVSVISNGTLIKPDRVRSLFKFSPMLSIHVSIDGSAPTHNKNRKFRNSGVGSHEIVIKNCQYLLKYFPFACARMVITDLDIFREDLDYLLSKGFRYFCFQCLRGPESINSQEYLADYTEMMERTKEYLASKTNVFINEISYPYDSRVADAELIERAEKSEDEYHYFMPNGQKCFQKTYVANSFQHFTKGSEAEYNLLKKEE